MDDGQQIDWRAIPRRFRAWQAKPLWRKLLWILSRTVTMVVAYVFFGAAVLWYNQPTAIERIAAGTASPLSLLSVLAAQPALLAILAIMVPAVLVAVLLPHKPSWR